MARPEIGIRTSCIRSRGNSEYVTHSKKQLYYSLSGGCSSLGRKGEKEENLTYSKEKGLYFINYKLKLKKCVGL